MFIYNQKQIAYNKFFLQNYNIKSQHNILFIHHSCHFSGAENSLLHLTTRLDKDKFFPIFLCPKKGQFSERLLEKNIPIVHFEFGKNRELVKLLRSIRKICQVARYLKIGLIHSNGPQTNIPAGIAGRLLNIPVVWHARNLVTDRKIDIDRFTGFLPQRIFCNSDAIRDRFKGKRLKKTTKTIMNGIDLKDFDRFYSSLKVRKEFAIPSNAKVVGMCSRLGKDKGHLTLLKAVSRLKNRYSDLWILIVGENLFEADNDVPKYLKMKAREFGIAEKTVFTGFRKDVYRLYAGMDIFVLGTNAEPCGRVIFEAMAMAKPVLGTNNGGTPEIVIDGQTGLLFNYGDSKELSLKIDFLLSNKTILKRMGNAGRKRVKEKFTIDENVRKTQNEYFDLLQRMK